MDKTLSKAQLEGNFLSFFLELHSNSLHGSLIVYLSSLLLMDIYLGYSKVFAIPKT